MKQSLRKCYIYTRVSTSMQVDGYSLDAQKDKIKKYADYQEMLIMGEYSDEGKSGKSVEGRPDFKRMLNDIMSGKDKVDYVLVFKLSRFGRNAADVLNSLQIMQDYGVNLICVEDGIDSSKDAGKLMISVLSAVAEIERENILVQTMEGRKQKAREGGWNGGFAPYGYELINGSLVIADDEVEVVKKIFDLYIHTNMGVGAIAKYLNNQGYKKKKRQNNTLDTFAQSFVKGIIDNPVYTGKIAFGRRKLEKKEGTRNEYHTVKQDTYMLSTGNHEAIISEEEWELAQAKRKKHSHKRVKVHSVEHEHILSSIVKCPMCGGGMYGNVNRKKKPDGTLYRDYFYYACKHRTSVDGHLCNYRKQWGEERVNDAVVEVVRKLVQNPRFAQIIKDKINAKIDTGDLDLQLENYKKQLAQVVGTKATLEKQMDTLDVLDKHYERKYNDMQGRLDALYDTMVDIEQSIEEVETRKKYIEKEKINCDNVYKYLLNFDKVYDMLNDMEKKTLFNSFVDEVHLYPQELENGQFLKKIKFKFPVFYNGEDVREICWDKDSSVECVIMMQYKPNKLG